MYVVRRWIVLVLTGVLAGGGCVSDEPASGAGAGGPSEEAIEAPSPPPPAVASTPMSREDSLRVRAGIAVQRDSVYAALRRVPQLSPREVAELRQDRNAEQVASARRLGVRAGSGAEMERLRHQGQLVTLGDSTRYWVLREMEHSVPLVTPDTRAMLEELGRRFHARLDAVGLPRYRIKVTSALRTDETQADLRKTNSYASRTVSAHEFGTTIDLSHERFAVPAGPRTGPQVEWEMEAAMLEEVGKEESRALQAELGRAIAEMRDQGMLHVMMENRQPVYHITLARRFPSDG